MTQRLAGKSILITGASAGIGWASAEQLAAEGAHLLLTARRQERLETLAGKIHAAGGKATIVAGDAAQESTAKACVRAAVEAYGKLDILINNAGVGTYKNLTDITADEYDTMIDTNVRSTFLFSKEAVAHMLPRKTGLIVTVSSVAGLHGFARESVYCATKFAQRGFMQALDNELRPHGVRCSLICPGGVKTEFAIGTGRTEEGVAQSGMMEASEVADAVVLACTAPETSRIVEIVLRPMVEPLK